MLPAATTTLANLMAVVVTAVVDIATVVFTDYFPYIIVIMVILALIKWFKRLATAGAH
jgi:hypothetical protein